MGVINVIGAIGFGCSGSSKSDGSYGKYVPGFCDLHLGACTHAVGVLSLRVLAFAPLAVLGQEDAAANAAIMPQITIEMGKRGIVCSR